MGALELIFPYRLGIIILSYSYFENGVEATIQYVVFFFCMLHIGSEDFLMVEWDFMRLNGIF